ncbi:hypothetical protein KFL_001090250 [Klebsormidium nitens]|uniref:Uncharacterized protein n=1 Tax=Klebsormidium nitens TaxID=105231 RepID=A0A1Y1I0R4_KLENI|nr:hypothetical protein KFL_001090250 [Klebsormidium nitens]|eukprot:GAQ82377.1 hypothetical protein KFL_001090250 [Klebsormidium nitens]
MASGNYQQGKNWTSGGDGKGNATYSNGYGEKISNPSAYFDTVAKNSYGYNNSYSNGNGKGISNPGSYFKAVAEDRYGYNKK